MTTIPPHIINAEHMTSIFGRWPSFHDAEVLDVHLDRGRSVQRPGVQPQDVTLTVRIHLWELTDKVDSKGFLATRNHTLATLRFHRVEDVKLEAFNHQNVLHSLCIEATSTPTGGPTRLTVGFESSYGLEGEFTCAEVEVVSAEPFSPPKR